MHHVMCNENSLETPISVNHKKHISVACKVHHVLLQLKSVVAYANLSESTFSEIYFTGFENRN